MDDGTYEDTFLAALRGVEKRRADAEDAMAKSMTDSATAADEAARKIRSLSLTFYAAELSWAVAEAEELLGL